MQNVNIGQHDFPKLLIHSSFASPLILNFLLLKLSKIPKWFPLPGGEFCIRIFNVYDLFRKRKVGSNPGVRRHLRGMGINLYGHIDRIKRYTAIPYVSAAISCSWHNFIHMVLVEG
jgi:hypothetical protein